MTQKETNLRIRMQQNATCYNKHLTENYFSDKTTSFILSLTHPLDRLDFSKEYRKIKEMEACDDNI